MNTPPKSSRPRLAASRKGRLHPADHLSAPGATTTAATTTPSTTTTKIHGASGSSACGYASGSPTWADLLGER